METKKVQADIGDENILAIVAQIYGLIFFTYFIEKNSYFQAY